MHKCPMKYICALCSTEPSSIVTSCGCTFCSSCYNEIKSFISFDSVRCIICEEHIDFTKSLDINSPSIVNQLNISSGQKKKVIEFLKMNNESTTKNHQSNKENDINIPSSSVDSNSSTLVNTSVKRSRKRNYVTMLQHLKEVSIHNNNMDDYNMIKRFKYN